MGASSLPQGRVKVVGKSGQIALGKQYAGKRLQLQLLDDGSILLRPVVVIPESQVWTLAEPHRSRIARRGLRAEKLRTPSQRARPSETNRAQPYVSGSVLARK
jgi:hypothetical protein